MLLYSAAGQEGFCVCATHLLGGGPGRGSISYRILRAAVRGCGGREAVKMWSRIKCSVTTSCFHEVFISRKQEVVG